MAQKALLPTLLITLAISIGYSYKIARENSELQLQLQHTTQRSLEELRRTTLDEERHGREIKELKRQLEQSRSANREVAEPRILPPIKTESKPKSEKLSRPEWQTKVNLRRVESHLALTTSERSALEEKFKSGEGLSALGAVVGEERAKKFFEDEERERKESEEDAIRDKVFKLSRILNLTHEQEDNVRSALVESRAKLKSSYVQLRSEEAEAMALHSEPDRGEELRAVYERYRAQLEEINSKENELVTSRLKSVLNEEQMNKLLELIATEKVGLR